MKTLIRIFFLHLLVVWAFACTSDIDGYEQSIDNKHIKSVSSYGQVRAQYFYDNAGKIREIKGKYSYQKFLYDNNNRLMKVEYAADEAFDVNSVFSSSLQPPGAEIKPSGKYKISHYKLFKYDNQGQLSKIEHHFMMNGKNFELRSISTFEHEGKLIKKENLCDETGKINQYYVFAYDKNGNLINIKNYSNLFGDTNKLIYETSYEYDSFENPFMILNILGSPSFYHTSANNMIKITTTFHTNDPRTEIATQIFDYNNLGYPIKMTYEGGEEEYTY